MSNNINRQFAEATEHLIDQARRARAALEGGDSIRTRAELARTMVKLVSLYNILNGD